MGSWYSSVILEEYRLCSAVEREGGRENEREGEGQETDTMHTCSNMYR